MLKLRIQQVTGNHTTMQPENIDFEVSSVTLKPYSHESSETTIYVMSLNAPLRKPNQNRDNKGHN